MNDFKLTMPDLYLLFPVSFKLAQLTQLTKFDSDLI